jgi:hypothetical protein
MRKQTDHDQLSVNLARKIMERAAAGERAMVVVTRGGKPSSVHNLEEYLAKRKRAPKARPWTFRKTAAAVPDPLGAVEGAVLLPIMRRNIYEE